MKNIKKSGLKPGVIIRRSKHKGLGLFARHTFKKDEFIIQYTGEVLPTLEADRQGGMYLFILNKQYTLNGATRKNIARYANHSCRPNAESDVKNMKVLITAKRPIVAGEEITYDYGKEFFNEFIKPKGCRCGFCNGKGKKIPLRTRKRNSRAVRYVF